MAIKLMWIIEIIKGKNKKTYMSQKIEILYSLDIFPQLTRGTVNLKFSLFF